MLILTLYGFFIPQFSKSFFWLTAEENWGHFIYGAIGLGSVYFLSEKWQTRITCITATTALFMAIWTILVFNNPFPNFYAANLEYPTDFILYGAISILGFVALFLKKISRYNLLSP